MERRPINLTTANSSIAPVAGRTCTTATIAAVLCSLEVGHDEACTRPRRSDYSLRIVRVRARHSAEKRLATTETGDVLAASWTCGVVALAQHRNQASEGRHSAGTRHRFDRGLHPAAWRGE